MNIKQRARELLTCDELRGRVPEEVQDFLRDVVALEPVCYFNSGDLADVSGVDDGNGMWMIGFPKPSDGWETAVYTLGAPNDPA